MKICLVSDNLMEYHQTWSGAEIVCKHLASLLQREGQEVVFLTLRSEKKEVPENIFPTPALNGQIWSFKKIIPIHILLRTVSVFLYLKKIKPDLIHLFQARSLFIPVMVSTKILKIPTTFTFLDYFLICPSSHFLLKNGEICTERMGWNCLKCVSLPRLFGRQIIRLLAKNLNQLITFTETSKKRLIKQGFPPEKIKVKYIYEFSLEIPAVDQEKISENNNILFVGSFRQQKGLDVLIQALPNVLAKIPDSKLIVVGRGNEPDTARIENLVNELKVEESIKFLGQKKNEETLQLISKSAVVVIPEQWLSDFGPIILIEAMALGKPVVTSKIGSAPEFVKDNFNGFLVEYNKPEQFAKKIIWLLKNKKTAQLIGERAKESVQFLFKSNQSQEIFKLYNNI